MDRILTTAISDTSGLPILGRTLDFIQDSFTKQDLGLLYGDINLENTDYLLFVYGGIISFGTGTISITKGLVQYGNEFYQVDAETYTYTTLSNVGLNFSDTYQTGEPTPYTDGITRDTNRYRKLSFSESPIGGINYLNFRYVNRADRYYSYAGANNIYSGVTVSNCTLTGFQMSSIKKGNLVVLTYDITLTSTNTVGVFATISLNPNYNNSQYIATNIYYPSTCFNVTDSTLVSGQAYFSSGQTLHLSLQQSNGNAKAIQFRGQITYITNGLG